MLNDHPTNRSISFAVVQNPETRSQGRLLEREGRWADLSVACRKPVRPGDLVEFETKQTLFLGEVDSSEPEGDGQHLRVRLEHVLDLEKTAWIQKLWDEE